MSSPSALGFLAAPKTLMNVTAEPVLAHILVAAGIHRVTLVAGIWAILLLDAYDIEAMSQGTKRERGVVGGHDQINPRQVFPQQGSGKMNCVECAKFRRHWLGGPIEDDRVDFHEFE